MELDVRKPIFRCPHLYKILLLHSDVYDVGNNATLVRENVGGSTMGTRNEYGCAVVAPSVWYRTCLCCTHYPVWVRLILRLRLRLPVTDES